MWRKLVHCCWEGRLVQPLWKTVWNFLRKRKMEVPFDPAIPICPFLNWVVFYFGVELYKFFIYLEINPLWDLSLAKKFSHSVHTLFILSMVSSGVQRFFFDVVSCVFPPLSLLPKEIYWQNYCYEKCLKFYCLCFLLGVLWFHNLYLLIHNCCLLGVFLITASILLIINSLFRFSDSSWFSFKRVYVSRNLSILLSLSSVGIYEVCQKKSSHY